MPRRTPNLVITIPPAGPVPPTPSRPSWRPTARPLLRIFPWAVACTLILWIYLLRADKPPLRLHSPEHHPPIDGHKPHPFHPQNQNGEDSAVVTWEKRSERVKTAFLHAYDSYTEFATGFDELLPLSAKGIDRSEGWRATLYDSLTTLHVMAIRDTFRRSLAIIAKRNVWPKEKYVRFQDAVSRQLGTLLSSYALSGEPVLLTMADDLASQLLFAFNTTHGLPAAVIDVISGKLPQDLVDRHSNMSWASIQTSQLEMKYLAHITGRPYYYNKTETVMTIVHNSQSASTMIPVTWRVDTGLPITFENALSSENYHALDTLLKQWILTAKSDRRTLDLYLKYVNIILNQLLFVTEKRGLLYLSDIKDGLPIHTFHQQQCAFPGLLALGVHALGISLPLKERELHLWAAQGLAYTCWVTYGDQTSGLSPELVQMKAWTSSTGELLGQWMPHLREWETKGKKGNGPPGTAQNDKYFSSEDERDYTILDHQHRLRPELSQTFYLLWRTTKNSRWRDRAWSIFESLELHARTEHGYATLLDVERVPPPLKDEMPSYFLGQTLKYLYLIFSNDDTVAVNSWVFNIHGHPLPVFHWSDWEKEIFQIT
ncbi:hypothetical protein CVT24_006302 [Panaeolus cyanescens]|uniref:alpha-1,2-Mannosidase n=1 Tax=Panaeolus cyanescens TaxID=181874 RepID=A0A409V8K5_9AGAR|nr:hypothetical protein CVT24_006302 [Panaeolus cyanescens]